MTIEYLLIKKIDDFFSTEEEFKNLLCANARITIDGNKIYFSNKTLSFSLSKEEVPEKKEIIFHFSVSTDKDRLVQALEDFDSLLRRINKECGQQFIIDTIWDDVSIFHTKNLYPQMVEIENLLRKLIYRFMIKTVGMTWFDKAVPTEFKKAIKETINKSNETDITEDHLYYADFIQLCIFLFEPYPSKPSENLLRDLKKNVDGKKPIEAYTELVQIYDPKSNWERYFAEKIEIDDLDEKWRKLYGFRNQVAHAKRMRKKEYDEAIALINELKPAFQGGLDHVDNVILTEEETETVKEAAKAITQPIYLASTLRKEPDSVSSGLYTVLDDGSIRINYQRSPESYILSGGSYGIKNGVYTVSPDAPEVVFSTVTPTYERVAKVFSASSLAKPVTIQVDDPNLLSNLKVDAGNVVSATTAKQLKEPK